MKGAVHQDWRGQEGHTSEGVEPLRPGMGADLEKLTSFHLIDDHLVAEPAFDAHDFAKVSFDLLDQLEMFEYVGEGTPP